MGLTNLPSQENTSEKYEYPKVGDLVQYFSKHDGDGAWLSYGSYGIVLKVSVNSKLFDVAQVHWIGDESICFICCSYLKIIS